jgi:5-methylcytosine-specific restriction endonuclease McrA
LNNLKKKDNKESNKENEEEEDKSYKYKCQECGIDFGNSLGDMELHKLTFHVQKGDMEIK